MNKIYLLIFGLVLLATIIKFIDLKLETKDTPLLSYHKKKYFFSIAERKFYGVLKEVAIELNLELFAKVRLADIIYSDGKTGKWLFNWNKIKSKHIDFLLCDKENYSPIICIELDDSSHLQTSRVSRDKFENEALNRADLKLVRFKVQSNYTRDEIKIKLL